MEKVKYSNSAKDSKLVDIVRNGEVKDADKAFGELFEKYHELIIRTYRRRVTADADAEDLAMEVMAKCHKNLSLYKEDNGAFSTWLFTLTRNLFIDNFRKQKAQVVSINELGAEDSNGHFSEKDFDCFDLNAEQELIKAERAERLSVLIASVLKDKPHLKEILEMRYFSELSYEEIAKLAGCPLGTVKAHLFRAKEILREAIIKDDIEF